MKCHDWQLSFPYDWVRGCNAVHRYCGSTSLLLLYSGCVQYGSTHIYGYFALIFLQLDEVMMLHPSLFISMLMLQMCVLCEIWTNKVCLIISVPKVTNQFPTGNVGMWESLWPLSHTLHQPLRRHFGESIRSELQMYLPITPSLSLLSKGGYRSGLSDQGFSHPPHSSLHPPLYASLLAWG